MTATETIREVVSVSRQGATIRTDGATQFVPWGTLRAASQQEDTDLAAIYLELLNQANAVAASQKEVVLSAVNPTNTNNGHAAILHDVAGQFVSGRIVAADWGQSGSRHELGLEIERAKETLARKGYTVHDAS